MTARYHAEAPGKLFLLGEYAVLDGCPAIVVAVEPKLHVLGEHTGARHEVTIAIPKAGFHSTVEAAALPATADGPFAFVLGCFQSCPEEERRAILPGLKLVIEFPQPKGTGTKLGLGGSAALVAAVSALLFELAHGRGSAERHRTEVFARALRAHQLAQQGRGSGADVAASVFGGLLLFQASNRNSPRVEPLPWPEDLALASAWSGRPASTCDLITAYQNGAQQNAGLHRHFLDRSARSVEAFAVAVRSRRDPQAAWCEAAPLLLEFAPKLGLDYLTPELEHILALARTRNTVAKPSGAGGGDSAVALCPPDEQTSLTKLWEGAGFPCLGVRPAKEGVGCG